VLPQSNAAPQRAQARRRGSGFTPSKLFTDI
jgi:hypothetical protein